MDTSVIQELESHKAYILGYTKKTKETLGEVAKAFGMAPHGLNAVLLIAKYGARFTIEDSQALKLLLKFLGKESEQYMILILTQGDQARVHAKDEGVSIEVFIKNWLKTLPAWVQEFIEEIKGRVILFNNMLRNDTVAEAQAQANQLADLVNTIDAIAQGKKPYVNKLTEASEKELSEQIEKAIEETGMLKELQELTERKEESTTKEMTSSEIEERNANMMSEKKKVAEKALQTFVHKKSEESSETGYRRFTESGWSCTIL